ncbi:MAG: tripartite tricarboxylate transporter substrate-binding protein, partial [Pseudomonadota bacterium]
FYEVAPHVTDLGHIYSISAVAFSSTFWKRLSPAQQAIVQAAAAEGIKLQDKLIAEGDEEAMKKAVAAGSKYHKVDKAPWQKAMMPIYSTWASKVGGMEMIKAKTRIDVTHVPYKGNALAGLDLAAGRIQLLFSNIAGVQMVRAGKAKLIAVMTPKRMPAYPNVPTVAESGIPGFELSNTYTLYTLSKTPLSIVTALNREIIQILASPELKERYAADASEVSPPYTPDELNKMFSAEFDKWDAVVKAANVAGKVLY